MFCGSVRFWEICSISFSFSMRFLFCFRLDFRSFGPKQRGLRKCEILGDLVDLTGLFNEVLRCFQVEFRSFGPKQRGVWKFEFVFEICFVPGIFHVVLLCCRSCCDFYHH